MTEKTNVAMHVRQLISGVTDEVDRHLAEADNDLRQTSLLLDEAIVKLTTSFIAIHAAVNAHQDAMRDLAKNSPCTRGEAATSLAQCQEISRYIDAAMIGLQFQDMTDQLIKRSSRRIAGVREICTDLCTESETLAAGPDEQATGDLLKQFRERMQGRSNALHQTMWKAVCQTHMESGEVDMF